MITRLFSQSSIRLNQLKCFSLCLTIYFYLDECKFILATQIDTSLDEIVRMSIHSMQNLRTRHMMVLLQDHQPYCRRFQNHGVDFFSS